MAMWTRPRPTGGTYSRLLHIQIRSSIQKGISPGWARPKRSPAVGTGSTPTEEGCTHDAREKNERINEDNPTSHVVPPYPVQNASRSGLKRLTAHLYASCPPAHHAPTNTCQRFIILYSDEFVKIQNPPRHPPLTPPVEGGGFFYLLSPCGRGLR